MPHFYRDQEPPFCLQIELAEGCNLACTFCGINGIRAKAGGPFKFMTEGTAATLARQIALSGWNSRLEFAMHGEPTMNPEWTSILHIFRTHLQKHSMMMTSNGGGLLKDPGPSEWLRRAFRYLDTFALDNYTAYKIGAKVLDNLYLPDGILYMHYPDGGPEASPHNRPKKRQKRFIVVKDLIEATKGNHSKIYNHAGAAAPPVRLIQACVKPFREFSIRWDGSIAVCCNDWRGEYKIGNIHDTPIEELWQSDPMQAARRFLYNGKRDIDPCRNCDWSGFRLGLLPDPLGKHSLPMPTETDYKIAEDAMAGAPFTPVVARPWEK